MWSRTRGMNGLTEKLQLLDQPLIVSLQSFIHLNWLSRHFINARELKN